MRLFKGIKKMRLVGMVVFLMASLLVFGLSNQVLAQGTVTVFPDNEFPNVQIGATGLTENTTFDAATETLVNTDSEIAGPFSALPAELGSVELSFPDGGVTPSTVIDDGYGNLVDPADLVTGEVVGVGGDNDSDGNQDTAFTHALANSNAVAGTLVIKYRIGTKDYYAIDTTTIVDPGAPADAASEIYGDFSPNPLDAADPLEYGVVGYLMNDGTINIEFNQAPASGINITVDYTHNRVGTVDPGFVNPAGEIKLFPGSFTGLADGTAVDVDYNQKFQILITDFADAENDNFLNQRIAVGSSEGKVEFHTEAGVKDDSIIISQLDVVNPRVISMVARLTVDTPDEVKTVKVIDVDDEVEYTSSFTVNTRPQPVIEGFYEDVTDTSINSVFQVDVGDQGTLILAGQGFDNVDTVEIGNLTDPLDTTSFEKDTAIVITNVQVANVVGDEASPLEVTAQYKVDGNIDLGGANPKYFYVRVTTSFEEDSNVFGDGASEGFAVQPTTKPVITGFVNGTSSSLFEVEVGDTGEITLAGANFVAQDQEVNNIEIGTATGGEADTFTKEAAIVITNVSLNEAKDQVTGTYQVFSNIDLGDPAAPTFFYVRVIREDGLSSELFGDGATTGFKVSPTTAPVVDGFYDSSFNPTTVFGDLVGGEGTVIVRGVTFGNVDRLEMGTVSGGVFTKETAIQITNLKVSDDVDGDGTGDLPAVAVIANYKIDTLIDIGTPASDKYFRVRVLTKDDLESNYFGDDTSAGFLVKPVPGPKLGMNADDSDISAPMSPSQGTKGSTVTFTIKGSYLNRVNQLQFWYGKDTDDDGTIDEYARDTGMRVTKLSVDSKATPNEVSCTLDITQDANTGMFAVKVLTSDGQEDLYGDAEGNTQFEVTGPAPSIKSFWPKKIMQGVATTIRIRGKNLSTNVVIVPGDDISLSNLALTEGKDGREVTGILTPACDADLSARTVTMVDGINPPSEISDAFTVIAQPSNFVPKVKRVFQVLPGEDISISSIYKVAKKRRYGNQGETQDIVIEGKNFFTCNDPADIAIDLGAGVTIATGDDAPQIVSAEKITAQIIVDADAPTTKRNVNLTLDGKNAIKVNAFRINPPQPTVAYIRYQGKDDTISDPVISSPWDGLNLYNAETKDKKYKFLYIGGTNLDSVKYVQVRKYNGSAWVIDSLATSTGKKVKDLETPVKGPDGVTDVATQEIKVKLKVKADAADGYRKIIVSTKGGVVEVGNAETDTTTKDEDGDGTPDDPTGLLIGTL